MCTPHTGLHEHNEIDEQGDCSFFPQYKWNDILKKSKIERNNINNCPNMIEHKRKKFAGIIFQSAKQSKDKITKSNPQIKFNELYINCFFHLAL